jgi:hypothetical protein
MSEPMDPREQYGEHGEWDALAVGWALSALDPEDEERFAAHLPGCDRCTESVKDALHTVADLAYALPDEAPPPSLKTRLMAAVSAEPRESGAVPPLSAEGEWPAQEALSGHDWFIREEAEEAPNGVAGDFYQAPEATPPSVDPIVRRPDDRADERRADGLPPSEFASARPPVQWSSDEGPVRPGIGGRQASDADESDVVVPFERPRRRRRFAVSAAAAAVVALVAGLAVWNVQLRSSRDDLRQVVAQREAAIQQLTANGPARVAAMTSDGKPSESRRATLVVRGNQVEIIVETLGPTSANQTYWLWTLNCDTTTPSNLKPIQGFTVTQSDFSVRDIGSEPGVSTATCFALSSEVGTATPTAPRLVVAVGQPK